MLYLFVPLSGVLQSQHNLLIRAGQLLAQRKDFLHRRIIMDGAEGEIADHEPDEAKTEDQGNSQPLTTLTLLRLRNVCYKPSILTVLAIALKIVVPRPLDINRHCARHWDVAHFGNPKTSHNAQCDRGPSDLTTPAGFPGKSGKSRLRRDDEALRC